MEMSTAKGKRSLLEASYRKITQKLTFKIQNKIALFYPRYDYLFDVSDFYLFSLTN